MMSVLTEHGGLFFNRIDICVKIYVQKHVFAYSSQNFVETEPVVRKHSVKKVFLKILQNSQENTYAGVSF